ncbi:MAG: lipase maturation factor family protein [Isosphaeraceae bacterium]
MGRGEQISVAARPTVPLLAYDGDCDFCRRWVLRWRAITGDRAEYLPFQEVAVRFPEIGEERFRGAAWLIEPGGRATSGARAVLGLHALAGDSRWPAWLYESLPGFADAAEAVYGFVSRHRGAAGRVTTLLWGAVPERPRYRRTRAVFLRGLGLIYLMAFASLAVQVDGLIGSRGILPAAEFLGSIGGRWGVERFWMVPSLLWLDASDRSLHALCWGGMALAAALIIGVWPRACLAGLWLAYLSLVVVGDPFLAYQWDSLLLEAGLLGVLLAPGGFWLGRARREPSRAAVGLVRWLLFRLMFLAGVVKLTSGDPTWWAWEALRYHYETQPLPAWTSWYMHQLPPWFQAASVGFVFWAELVAPLLIFAPRRPRMVAFATLVTFQMLIAATGNFGFFNLLSMVLCLVLVEDRDWGRPAGDDEGSGPRGLLGRAAIGAACLVIVAVTTMKTIDRSGPVIVFPESLEALSRAVAPFRSLNSYGLFAVMTTERREILVEGSDDGVSWTAYEFRWKPGDPGRAPRFTTPHLPRLDWQMWFAALGRDCRSQPWFLAFERRLLEGSPEVRNLLRPGTFADRPPRYLRARLTRYRFTGPGEAAWWRCEELGTYCPPVGLFTGTESADVP